MQSHFSNTTNPLIKPDRGYAESQIDHAQPALTEPKTILRKQEAEKDALQKCLKSFIKQRMFGNLISHHTKGHASRVRHGSVENFSQLSHQRYNQQKTFLTSKLDCVESNKNNQIKRASLLCVRKGKLDNRISLEASILDRTKSNSTSSIVQKSALEQRKFAPNMQLVQLKNKRIPLIQSRRTQKRPTQVTSLLNSPRDSLGQIKHSSMKKNSVIQEDQSELQMNKLDSHFDISFISSIGISDKVQNMMGSKKRTLPQLKKLQKNKRPYARQSVSDETWSVITIVITRGKDLPKILPPHTRTIHAILNYAQFLMQRKVLHRQSYVKHIRINFQRLASKFLSYFDLKTHQGMGRREFTQLISVELLKAHQRIWAFMLFQFWDLDENGVIDSSDLFSIYQMLESEIPDQKIQQNGFEDRRSRRQKCRKILLQQISFLNRIVLDNKNRQSIINLKIDEAQENKSVLELNNVFHREKHDQKLPYLQQSLIKNHETSLNEIRQIVRADQYSKDSNNKKFPLNISQRVQVKFSSCYRQSYLAMEHNDQTRHHREKIQVMKLSLKKQRQTRVIRNGGITYQQFLQFQGQRKVKEYLVYYHGWIAPMN